MFERLFNRKILAHIDYILPLFVLPLVLLSAILIAEINQTLSQKHLIYTSVGIAVFAVITLFPIRSFVWLIPGFYWLGIGLLVLTDLVGVDRGMGAQRWLELPLIRFTLQPSEIIKPALILMLAYKIAQDPPPKGGYRLRKFLVLSLYILLPAALILMQPDLGTTIAVFIICFGTLFLIGVHYKIWLTILAMFALLAPILYTSPLIKDYQRKRVMEFLKEEPAYQIKQSLIAIGSGGYSGKTKSEATQAQLKFLPIATSDFIFAYFAERFGFWGSIGLLLLYLLLILYILSIALNDPKDYLLKCVALSVGLMLFIYTAVNIAMVVGLLPVVGIPLPLFSYGGSSFVTFMILFGIIESLLAFKFNFVYNAPHFVHRKGP
ncbi:MAG: rod shape-determining protein RodA [Helicobacter sp.]|nr:rod shape-determining protein RodA [Helicobacter sp.]